MYEYIDAYFSSRIVKYEVIFLRHRKSSRSYKPTNQIQGVTDSRPVFRVGGFMVKCRTKYINTQL